MVSYITFFEGNTQKSNAIEFVTQDLKANYPDADVEILLVNEKKGDGEEKYYEIKAKVTQGYQSSCPVRTHVYYNYPNQNFVPQAPEYITSGCKVCNQQPCIIAFPEEAIIASHTLSGTEEVRKFINENTTAAAGSAAGAEDTIN